MLLLGRWGRPMVGWSDHTHLGFLLDWRLVVGRWRRLVNWRRNINLGLLLLRGRWGRPVVRWWGLIVRRWWRRFVVRWWRLIVRGWWRWRP